MAEKRNDVKKLKSPILTVNAVIYENHKVLLPKRAVWPYIDYWELPGGHVDYGETVEAAIKREVREELGIGIEIKGIIGVYSDPKRNPNYHAVTIAYLVKRKKGILRLSSENSDFKWFPLNNLPKKMAFDFGKVLRDFKKQL